MSETSRRTYKGDRDFKRIRDFLIETYSLYQRPFNWLLDRWNFCRYHVIPLHTHCNVRYFGVPTGTAPPHRDELPFWQQTIGIWENEANDVVGVVHSENEEPGEAWIQIHPDYTFLYDEMVDYIEGHLINWTADTGYVNLYVNQGSELEPIAEARGYRKLERYGTRYLVHRMEDLPEPQLPPGFEIRSVADEDDVERRRRAKALAFGGHYNPTDWPPAAAFIEMQKAPDYRSELDLFVVAPGGEYVSFCTAGLDVENKYGNFEPVGTHVEYRGMGLGRALLMEGFRRMAGYGVERSYMDANVGFYRKVGFELLPYGYYPWIKYLPR